DRFVPGPPVTRAVPGEQRGTGSAIHGGRRMQGAAQAAGVRRPANIDQLILIVQREFPRAGIRVTGRAWTVRRQAELMAQRIRASRLEFLRTYRTTRHIIEMDEWFRRNPRATERETVDEFERLIREACARGARV